MKIVKWAFVVWVISVTLVIGLASVGNHGTYVNTFCAYSRVFVEFEENGKRWGTIMLDYEGKPIPCVEGKEDQFVVPNHIVTKERKLYDQSI